MIATDGKADKDLLGRDIFAGQIVKSLTSSFEDTSESLVVGIAGNWGSGKSTLLSYIKNHLDNQSSGQGIKIIEFNSWGNTGEDSLERNFLETILEKVSGFKWGKDISKANQKLKKYLSYLKYVKFLKHTNGVVKGILDGVDDYVNGEGVGTVGDLKEAIGGLLAENNVKIYILIDDLDRLTPKEITAVFKMLKVNLNMVNTFFVIAYDKEVVIRALETEYGVNGERYLEKIIQVDFSMPPVLERQLEEILFSRLKAYLLKLGLNVDLEDLQSSWRLHGLGEYFHSIRDVNRYLNNLVFSLPNIQNDIFLLDFLLLEAIRTFDHRSYQRLHIEIPMIRRQAIWADVGVNENFVKRFTNGTTASLLDLLLLNDYGKRKYMDPKRLRDPEYFERYFSLMVPSTDVTESYITAFFSEGSNKFALLSQILETDKMHNFLKRISNPNLEIRLSSSSKDIFANFIGFWNQRPDRIDFSYKSLIISAYFNLINFFDDSHKAVNFATEAVSLNRKPGGKIGFVIIYQILIDRVSGVSPAVIEQFRSKKAGLTAPFEKYLADESGFSFMHFREGEISWVDSTFLFAMARFLQKEYIEKLEENLQHPQMGVAIVKHFLLLDQQGNAGTVDFGQREQLLPGGLLAKLLSAIRGYSRSELNALDYKNLLFFVEGAEELMRSETLESK